MTTRSIEIISSGGTSVPSLFAEAIAAIDAALDEHAPHPRALAVTVVFTDDLGAAVENAWRLGGQDFGPIDAERLGGTVRGKAIPVAADASEAWVVIDGPWWSGNDDSVSAQRQIAIVAHELFHPRLDRLRVEAGVDLERTELLDTPRKGARWSVRSAADELRCDLAADSVLRAASPWTRMMVLAPCLSACLGLSTHAATLSRRSTASMRFFLAGKRY